MKRWMGELRRGLLRGREIASLRLRSARNDRVGRARRWLRAGVHSLLLAAMLASSLPTEVIAERLNSQPGEDISYGLTLGEPGDSASEPVPILSEQVPAQAQLQQDEERGVRLRLTAEPAIYIPGKNVRIAWQMQGREILAAEGATLVVLVPNGASLVGTEHAQAADGTINIPGPTESGTLEWAVGTGALPPLNFTFELRSADGEQITSESAVIDQAPFTAEGTRETTLESPDERVKVTLPPNAAAEDLAVDIRYPAPQSLPNLSLTWEPIEIIAVGRTTGRNISQFNAPLTIQISYANDEMPFDWDESTLTIFYYDEEARDWFPLETTVDMRNKTLTAQSDHLTIFDYNANYWQSNSLPTVDAFKVADYTGAGTYAINLWTPPGPGGLQPALALTYNSQVIDEGNAFSQASWVGMGWNLETGAIVRNMHASTGTGDDTFMISAGGVSGVLLPISVSSNIITYNTADQAFLKVQFDSTANKWSVWATDGTKYEFAFTTKTNATNGCTSTLSLTWSWSLSTVTDIHGNTLSYAYTNEAKSGACPNQIAVYPDSITYGNNKYRVLFVREGGRTDYQTSWTINSSRILFARERLSEIKVQHNGGAWQDVRRYVLSYAPNTETTNIVYPNLVWTAGGKTSTLVGIQEFGADGAALPAVQFTYSDYMHLTGVDNNQGGQVALTYTRWAYFDDGNKTLRFLYTNFGPRGSECFWGGSAWEPGTAWTKHSGSGVVNCKLYNNTGYMQVGGGLAVVAKRVIPTHIAKPGSRYLIRIDGLKDPAKSGTMFVNYGIRELTTGNQDLRFHTGLSGTIGIEDSFEFLATWNANDVQLIIEADKLLVDKYQAAMYHTWWQVTSRTVTVSPGGLSTTYSYTYDNSAPNTGDNSAAVASGATLYTPKRYEYRGNAFVQVKNSEGLATMNWFHQSDSLRGRLYETLTMQQSFYDGLASANWTEWAQSGGTVTFSTIGYTDFDRALKLNNSSANWSASVTRATAALDQGEVAVAHVRVTGTNALGRFGLTNGAQTLTIETTANSASVNGQTLLSTGNFAKSEWFAVMIFADAANGYRVRMWQLDDPSKVGEAVVSGLPGSAWKFTVSANNGDVWLDSYAEGAPFTGSTTRYTTTVQYDTIASNGIPDLVQPSWSGSSMLTYKDLHIAWNRASWSEQRNYEGGSNFSGVKYEYTYAAATAYGNLIKTVESAATSSSFTAYRSTEWDFFPNASAYVVSAPARQRVFACSPGCTSLQAETHTFYDSATSYTTPPTKGNVTMQRSWVSGSQWAQADFTYSTQGNLTSQSVYSGHGTATSSPPAGGKQTTTTTYDTGGYNTYPVSVSNALNQTTGTAWNYALAVPTSITDANNSTTSATYDGFGRIKTIVAPGDSGGAPTLQVTYWDARIPFQVDLIQRVDSASSIRLSRFYDGAGRQIQAQTVGAVVNGAVQTIVSDTQYNGLGRLIKQSVPRAVSYSASPDFVTQNFGTATTTTYDVLGRALTVTAPNGNQTSYDYGRLTTTVTDPKNNDTTTTVDAFGRPTLVNPPAGPNVSYAYDVLDRLAQVTRGGLTTTMTYDQLGRKTAMSDPDMGNWSYGYDGVGNLTSQTDARSCNLSLTYDKLNRLTGKSSSGGGCGQQVSTSYGYDSGTNGIGRRTSMTDASGSAAWTYDARGRMLSEVKTLTGAGNLTTSWTYNSADLPVTMTYPDSEVLTYAYNSDGSLKTIASSLGGYYMADMRYDEAGRITRMDYGDSIIRKSFGYFPFDTNINGGMLSSAVATRLGDSATLQDLGYSYDRNGNVLSIGDGLAGPQTQTFGYDALNRLTSAEATGGTDGLYNEAYTYNASTGNLASKAGVDYTYDANHPHAVGSLSNGNTYSYDANGNMIERIIESQQFDLAYDAENRLVSVTGPTPEPTATPTETLTPTETGTPTETETPQFTETPTDTAEATFTPSNTPEPPTITPTDTLEPPTPTPTDTPEFSPTPSDTLEFTYTPTDTVEASETPTPEPPTNTPTDTPAVGDTPTDTPQGDTPTPSDTPTETETPTLEITPTPTEEPEPIFVSAAFVYDGDGARVKQAIVTDHGEETTYFVGTYYEVTGEAVTKYYYAGGQRVAMRADGALAFLLGDHLGSTSLTTDVEGNVVAELRYTAWGEVRFDSGDLLTKYTYTGQYSYTGNFGLMFYNARWYDSALGRFAQADTIVTGGVQGLDRYAYVNNNPVKYIDPSGYALCSSLFGDCRNAPWRPEIVKANPSPQKPIASMCDGQSLNCRPGGHQDIGPSPKPNVPQVITVGELSLVIMPAGSKSALDTGEAWQSWAHTLGQGSVAADLVELLLIFNRIPLDEDLLALNDVLLESIGCYLNGECYVGSPHYTLPEMLIVNQDVIVTSGDFLAGLGKYLSAGAGSSVGGPAGAYAGYVKGVPIDVGSTSANLIYDVFRNEGVISNQVSVGLRPTFDLIHGLIIHKYILYYPE